MNLRLILISVLFVQLTVNRPVFGENSFLIKQKGFIKELFSRKLYFDCITETRKLAVYSNSNVNEKSYSYFILGNYYLGRQYKTVISRFNMNKIPEYNYRNSILLSQSYLRLGMYNESKAVLDYLTYEEVDKGLRYDLLLRRIEPLIYSSDYEELSVEINKSKEYIQDPQFNRLQKEIISYRNKSKKSVPLSVALSAVIPGLGQAYNGRYIDGFLSFLGVAVTAAGAWYFNRENDRGLFYSFTFFSAIFYAGNIYGAYNSAKIGNVYMDSRFKESIKNSFIPEYKPINKTDLKRLFN